MFHNDDDSCTSAFSSLDEFDLSGIGWSHLENVSGLDPNLKTKKDLIILVHSIKLCESTDPKPHLSAYTKWAMIHPQYDKYGKPVWLWCKNLYEPQIVNN